MRRTAGISFLVMLAGALGCSRPPSADAPVRAEALGAVVEQPGPLAPSRSPAVRPSDPAAAAGADPGYFGITVGVRPYFHVERSKLPHKLEPEGSLGYEAGLFISDEELGGGRLSLTYVPLEEDDQDRGVKAFWLDMSGGPEYRLWDAPITGKLRCEFGVSLLYLDFEKNTYNTYAAGGLARGVFGLYARESVVGLELSADLHGWVGADAHDFQTSWAGTLGVNFIAKF